MKSFDYIAVEGNLSFPEVEIKDVNGFLRLASLMDVSAVFTQSEGEGAAPGWFLFIHDRTLYKLKARGFRLLEDFSDAQRAGFPDAVSFYDARSHNIRSYREYEEIRKAGIADKATYSKAQKLGYVDNFEKFRQRLMRESENLPPDYDSKKITNALELYEHALANGFKDYGDFVNAFFAGFSKETEWQDARQRNFILARDYREAMSFGLSKAEELEEVREQGIKSKAEYDKYILLKQESLGKYSFDQAQLINALKRLQNGKKLSVNKLKDLLKQQQKEFFATNGNGEATLPAWYTIRLKTDEDYITLLLNNPDLKDHGKFDAEGEYYEVSRILGNKVLIDGANVAFGSSGRRGEFAKARLANILSIVKELKSMRFKDIVVISDASLRHKTIDKNVMDDIKKENITYLEAPALTQADEFILDLAKKSKCYVISNDMFRDYKSKDEWVAENIDRLRIPFMIVKGKAVLSSESMKMI